MKTKQIESLEKEINDCKQECKNYFNTLLTFVESEENEESKDFRKFEGSLFKQLLLLGKLLTRLYFLKKKGNFGKAICTLKGEAIRGSRAFTRTITCIFGKIKVERYFYYLKDNSFGALDIYLNLPKYTYSYFLSEFCNMLNINRAYQESSSFIEKFLGQKLYVSALETISEESSNEYEEFNKNIKGNLELQAYLERSGNEEMKENKKDEIQTIYQQNEPQLTIVSFDGVGVPMIKKEASKIKARNGRGEKRQKKKEALLGVEYETEKKERKAEEVAQRIIYPVG